MNAPDPRIQALVQQGLALHRGGRVGEARAQYEAALKLQPRNFDALQLMGMIAGQARDFRQAADFFARAAQVDGRDPQLHNNLGFALRQNGALDAAIAAFDRAIALKPDYAKAHNNRGVALAQSGRFAEALAAYDPAIALEPRNPESFSNRGSALAELGRPLEAIASFDQAVAIHPGYAEAWNNRGNALAEADRADEALSSYDRAIAIQSAYPDAHNNRGLALTDLERLDEAVAAFDRAIALAPGFAEAHGNRGVALNEAKRGEDALAAFDNALAIHPDYELALRNRGLTLLALGRWDEGWRLFERRAPEPATAHWRDYPLWLGDVPLTGKTVLVHYERGLGDTIQFCRFVPLLKQAGAQVVFAPQPALRPLLAALEVDMTDPAGTAISFDYQVPLMSLPHALRVTEKTLPGRDGYLAADPVRIAAWRQRIGDHGFRIGICWQGEKRKNDKGRSFPLAQFAGLSRVPGVRLISLHKGAGEAQLANIPPGMTVETLGADFDAGPGAFLDTAAVMAACDLVVTSDTSISHLAGALGVKTWVVLKYVPDWRWMLDRPDSPWYAAMRLFRQPGPGDWAGAFAAVEAALQQEMATT